MMNTLIYSPISSILSDIFGTEDLDKVERETRRGLDSFSRNSIMNVYEKDGLLNIQILVAGYKKEDISAKFNTETRILHITSKVMKDKKWYHKKISCDVFVPEVYDIDKIKVSCEDGVLTFAVPEREEKKPVEIKIY